MNGVRFISIVLFLAASAAAQDTVPLKNGRTLSGTVTPAQKESDGLEVLRWDTGGVVTVRWDHIREADRRRLKGAPDAEAAAEILLEGVRILTPSREVIGVLVKEDDRQIWIKTKDAQNPVTIPTGAVIRRDAVKIRDSDAYGPDELIEQRLAAAPASPDAWLAIARFAASLNRHERAAEFLASAASAADPSRAEEIQGLIAANKAHILEGQAAALLEKIHALAEDADYPGAIESARKLLADYAETETAGRQAGLVAEIEKEAAEFEQRRAEVLARKVPEMYVKECLSLISKYAGAKKPFTEARQAVARLDEEIMSALAKKLKSTPEEVAEAWAKRTRKTRSASYGSGTWIVRGTSGGGMDTDAKQAEQPGASAGNDSWEDMATRILGGARRTSTQKDKGKKLQTQEEWWESAPSTERRRWLEAEYASTSAQAKEVVKETRKCSTCRGEGTLKTTRDGQAVDITCPRCHGVRDDDIVQYW